MLSDRINRVKSIGLYRLGFQTVVIGRINAVTTLMGFSHNKMYGHFARAKKKMAVITRQPY